jgi:hypothetical protein
VELVRLVTEQVKCEFLKGGSCSALTGNQEGIQTREDNCSNQNKTACCYTCSSQSVCNVSCNYLGEISQPDEASVDTLPTVKCSTCNVKMDPARTKIRIGGYRGLWKLAPVVGGVGELKEQLLPVLIYLCPSCGRLEFFAEQTGKRKLHGLHIQMATKDVPV